MSDLGSDPQQDQSEKNGLATLLAYDLRLFQSLFPF